MVIDLNASEKKSSSKFSRCRSNISSIDVCLIRCALKNSSLVVGLGVSTGGSGRQRRSGGDRGRLWGREAN